MKILHTVEYYQPSIGGMQEVVKQLSERLVGFGHEVTVATSFDSKREADVINNVKIEQFKISGNTVRGINADSSEIIRYQKFLKSDTFDVIVNFAAQQWSTDLMLDIIEDISAKKIFVPTGFSALYDVKYTKYFNLLKNKMFFYDAHVYLSNDYRDINFAKESGYHKNVVIPNGASENEFNELKHNEFRKKIGAIKEEIIILTVGSHTGAKGHYECIKIFEKAIIKNAYLIIVGNINDHKCGCYKYCLRMADKVNRSKNFKKNKKEVHIMNLTREDTVSAYSDADIFLFPSNIECSPIVLFEAMASGTPFLTTNVGNAKEIINWSNAGELLPTTFHYDLHILQSFKAIIKIIAAKLTNKLKPQMINKSFSKAKIKESAQLLQKIVSDQEYRRLLSTNGRAAWEKMFTWHSIAKQYETLYQKKSFLNVKEGISNGKL